MYELLIGISPFFNKNKKRMMSAIVKEDLIFPDRKKYKINYSDEAMRVIWNLLKKDPS